MRERTWATLLTVKNVGFFWNKKGKTEVSCKPLYLRLQRRYLLDLKQNVGVEVFNHKRRHNTSCTSGAKFYWQNVLKRDFRAALCAVLQPCLNENVRRHQFGKSGQDTLPGFFCHDPPSPQHRAVSFQISEIAVYISEHLLMSPCVSYSNAGHSPCSLFVCRPVFLCCSDWHFSPWHEAFILILHLFFKNCKRAHTYMCAPAMTCWPGHQRRPCVQLPGHCTWPPSRALLKPPCHPRTCRLKPPLPPRVVRSDTCSSADKEAELHQKGRMQAKAKFTGLLL